MPNNSNLHLYYNKEKMFIKFTTLDNKPLILNEDKIIGFTGLPNTEGLCVMYYLCESEYRIVPIKETESELIDPRGDWVKWDSVTDTCLKKYTNQRWEIACDNHG